WMLWSTGSRYQPGGTLTRAPSSRGHPTGRNRRGASEVAATCLFALDRLEQRLEVPLAEAHRAVALDQLEKERRAGLHRLGEDLEQVAVLVPVDQDPAGLQLLDRHPDRTDAGTQLRVVVVRVGGV